MKLRSLRAAVSATASIAAVAGVLAIMATPSTARADEGMWTFDNFPAAKVKQLYGFAPDQKWLDINNKEKCCEGVPLADGEKDV
jgi:hypothetical protein